MATGGSHYLWKKYQVCFPTFILERNILLHDLHLRWCHHSSSKFLLQKAAVCKSFTARDYKPAIKNLKINRISSAALHESFTGLAGTSPHQFSRHGADEAGLWYCVYNSFITGLLGNNSSFLSIYLKLSYYFDIYADLLRIY